MSSSSEQQLCASLREAGQQAAAAMNCRRCTPRRARELMAERVAANPAVAALLASPPAEGSLVVAALRNMECGANFRAVSRTNDRSMRFGADSAPFLWEQHRDEEGNNTAEQPWLDTGLLHLSSQELAQALEAALLLVQPLRAATDALRACCAPDGRLRAATHHEYIFLCEGQGRVLEHGVALLRQGRCEQLAREAAADIALDLGARALETLQALSVFDTKYDDGDKDGSVMRTFETQFVSIAESLHLALRCAMQLAGGGAAAVLPGGWAHAGCMLTTWQQVEVCTAHSALLRDAPSMRAMRATLAQGGAAMTFLTATLAKQPDAAALAARGYEPTLRRCAAPTCDEAEQIAGQFKKCARCGAAHYCSRACQKAHWKAGHKRQCGGAAGTHAQQP
jgi:hypothetical protein